MLSNKYHGGTNMGVTIYSKMSNENIVNVEEIFAMNVYTPNTMK